MSRSVLVCGGAGYIGSHMCQWLAEHGHSVTVLDDFSTGHRAAVRWGRVVEASLLDAASLVSTFERDRFDVVMHFCARSLVGESVQEPYLYYQNNVVGTLNLLGAMRAADVRKLVFSSTAAVFGHPLQDAINEEHPTLPINPYGASKLMVERMLADAARAYGLRSVALRYFNAAGALPEHGIGEAHRCETHLIPNAIKAALGSGPALRVFGDDYQTPDGTCIRDYVHVQDLASAHALAMEFMESNEGFHAFNLGSGQGFSVREVIDTVGERLGRAVPFDVAPRRKGDPAMLVAVSDKARSALGWVPIWTELPAIIDSAWHWHRDQKF